MVVVLLVELKRSLSLCRNRLSADHERLICFVLGAGEPTSLAAADKIYAATHRVIVKEGFFAGACERNTRARSLSVRFHVPAVDLTRQTPDREEE